MLKNSPKISDLTKRDVFQLNLPEINRKLAWKCCPAGFSSAWDPLTLWLLKGVLKQELSGIQVTHTSESINSEIFKLWMWSFFPKCPKFYLDFKNAIKIVENFNSFEDNCIRTCLWEFLSTLTRIHVTGRQRVKKVPRFKVWLREMLLTWFCLRLIENYDKTAAVQVSEVLGTQ